ncbi:hypothetical protein IKQ26_04795 [bacterium]|nr:hypothetical protein [bacterium]
MKITISGYEAVCNLGKNTDEIYKNALEGNNTFFETDKETAPDYELRLGKIRLKLPEIEKENYKTRCNSAVLYVLNLLENKIKELKEKYREEDIAIICATTNTGVDEFAQTGNKEFAALSNPAEFIKDYLNLKNIALSVSTACSSGNKAFGVADNLISSGVSKAAIVVGVDTIARLPLYGFSSLEILTPKPTNPLSKNYTGINIGEGCAIFIVEEKNSAKGIDIIALGENSDVYHQTTPNPEGTEAKECILEALKNAKLSPKDIDYINLHGTGTFANDLMETTAINEIFGTQTPSSSTKPLTGHCLGAAASIETVLCCHLLNNFSGKLFPHVFDGEYNPDLKPIKLIKNNETFKKCNVCLSNSFGFGGNNAIIILGKNHG